jgi:uncharacterized protein (TIGR03086 family)
MDDLVTLFCEGIRQFDARVAAVTPGDWDKPTPNAEWNVAALVDHLIDEHLWMPPLLGGQDLDAAAATVEAKKAASGADPAADWVDASAASEQAVVAPGALDRDVALSRGPTPASRYLVEMIFDLTVHSWDLGRAIGYEGALPDALVGFVFEIASASADEFASTGAFAPPVPVADDAPMIDRLVAVTGRDPR